MNFDVFPKWLGKYPVTDTAHMDGLDQLAGVNELSHKMPRHQAEKAAHEQYKKEQLIEASAHHYAGMLAAHGAGDMDAAHKHGAMYALNTKALGGDPIGEPLPEVMTAVKNNPAKVYRFKAHKGDAFAMPPTEEAPPTVKPKFQNERDVKTAAKKD